MKKTTTLSALAAIAAFTAFTLAAGELVVSPGGLTPHGALEAIRAAKAKNDASAWTVRVKPGIYALERTLIFTPADSGTPQAPVTWIGENGAVISGGAPLAGWKDTGKGWWSAPVPRGAGATHQPFPVSFHPASGAPPEITAPFSPIHVTGACGVPESAGVKRSVRSSA